MLKSILLINYVYSQLILLSAWYKSECNVYSKTARPDVMYFFFESFNTSYPAAYSYFSELSPINTCGFGKKGSETVISDRECCHVGRHPAISVRSASYGRVNYSDPGSVEAQMPKAANGHRYCNLRALTPRSLFSWIEMSIAAGSCSDFMKCSDSADKLEVYAYRNCTILRGSLNVTSVPSGANIGLGALIVQSVNISGALGEYKYSDQVPNQPYFYPEVTTSTEWFSVIYIALSQILLIYAGIRFGIKFWQKRTMYFGTCFLSVVLFLVNGGFVWKYLFTLVPLTEEDLAQFYILTGIQSILIALPTLIIAMQSVHGVFF
jgi:hypothetical protein